MKLFTVLVLALAACGSSSKKSDTTTTTASGSTTASADDTAMVDPTLPSWAPRSCAQYHVVVVKAVDCPDLDQPARDEIKAKYESQNTAWHNMTNAELADIEQIRVQCGEDMKAVEARAGNKCITAASM